MSIWGFLLEVVTAGAGGAALIAVVAYLARTWITERLKNAIAYEYNRDLETHKNQIAAISAAMAEGQKAAIEARYAGFDRLWKAILHLRNCTGIYLTYIDIITEQEYATFEKMKTLPRLLDDLDDKSFHALIPEEDIEEVRPYVGEVTWSLWRAYQAFNLRSVHLARKSRKTPQRKEYWRRDTMIREMLGQVLSKEEMAHMDALTVGGVVFVRTSLEDRVITAWRDLITGKQFGAETMRNSRDVLFAANAVSASAAKDAVSVGP